MASTPPHARRPNAYRTPGLFAFLLLPGMAVAQCTNTCGPNLICNPDLEITTPTCTGSTDAQIYVDQSPVECWYGIAGIGVGITPDNFNSTCRNSSTMNCGSGNGSIGFYTYAGAAAPNVREFVQSPLVAPLQAGKEYCFSTQVRLGPANFQPSDGLGIWFTNQMVDITTMNGGNSFLGPGSQVNATPYWMIPSGDRISGCVTRSGTFCAQGGETWIVIGNFRTDANTSIQSGGFVTLGYLIVDNLSLTEVCPPVPPLAIQADQTTVPCGGSTRITATGGSGTYTWIPNIGSGAGPHTVNPTVTTTYRVLSDVQGNCGTYTDTAQVTITVGPCGPTVTTMGGSACPGGCANVEADASGGPGGGPYTYQWSHGATGPGPHQVCPATTTTYTVTVTDANGNTGTGTVTVTIHPQTTLTASSTNTSCFGGSNGTVTANPSGGTPTHTFSWNTVPPQTGQTAGNLPPGTYTVTTTDANGCTATATATVGEPPPLTPTATSTPANCGVSDGSATANPAGGTSPYTYSWSTAPPQTGRTATNLPGGTYTVTVTDNNGCTATATVTVAQTGAAQLTTTQVEVRCNGGSDGEATVGATGGNPPYTYSWNTVPPQTTPTASNLPAGTWTVTVTDSDGCVATIPVTIMEPAALALTASADPDPCGAGEGSTSVTASGGTPPYAHSWSTTPAQTTPAATGLPAGTYTVTVTDNNGCTATASATVTTPAPPSPTTTAVNASCFGGSDGMATVHPAGGTGPYTFSWNTVPPQSSPTATGLPAGTYTVTVTDANGCTASVSADVAEPPQLLVTAAPDPANCGAQDGRATASPTGGTPPYTFSWNTVPLQATPIATGLPAGTYTVTVTDAKGCTASASTTVTMPTPGTLSVSHTNASCFSTADGSATVTVTGGSPPFTYAWNTVPPQTGPTAMNLPAGTWTVTVTDNEGCVVTAQAIIGQPSAIVPATSSTPTNCGRANGSASVSASGGSLPYTYSWNTVPPQTTATASGIAAGTYTVTITDANGCTTSTSVNVADIPGPMAGFTVADGCTGAPITFTNTSNGQSMIVSGWDFGDGNTSTQTNPAHNYAGPGTYTVVLVVTDAAGCTATHSSNVTVHPLPPVDFSATPVAGCVPVTTQFTNTTPPPGGTCLWSFGDGGTSTDCNGPVHTYITPGCHDVTLTLTSQAGCSSRMTSNNLVCVTAIPVADFGMVPSRVRDSAPIVSFINRSTGATNYYWEFNGGADSSTLANPIVDFTGIEAGEYSACLWAINSAGCLDSVCRTFTIFTEFNIHVPNAFTPDGDGTNDEFRPIITGYGHEGYELLVFNRWGELVFGTNNPLMGWNGYYNGVMSETEVYVWKLKVRAEETRVTQEFIGHVTLLR